MENRVINGIILVALLIAFPAFISAQAVPTLETIGLSGPVRSISTETVNYSYVNGDQVINSRQRGTEYEFDRDGNTVSELTFDTSGTVNKKQLFEFDREGRILNINTFARYSRLTGSEAFSYHSDGSRTVTEYDVDPSGRKVIKRVTEYGEAGLMVSQENYGPVPNSSERRVYSAAKAVKNSSGIRFTYSDSGRNETFRIDTDGGVQSNHYSAGNRTVNFDYTYKENGQLQKVSIYDSLGGKRSTWGLTYTADGSVSAIEHRDQFGRLITAVTFSSNPDGTKTKTSVHYGSNETPLFSWEYRYDTDGNETEKTLFYSGFIGRFIWTTRYIDGKAVEQTVTNKNGRILEGFRREYDNRGFMIKETMLGRNSVLRSRVEQTQRSEKEIESYIFFSAAGTVISHYTNDFNSIGQLQRNTVYNTDISILTVTEYQYEYDDYGNWILMQTYESSNPQEYYRRLVRTVRRNISYY